MKAFTDSDLERWKEIARRKYEWEPMPTDEIHAMIMRLEAAEWAISATVGEFEDSPTVIAWRQRAGKE